MALVAAIGGAGLVETVAWAMSARAATPDACSGPPSFADLVSRVSPAVVSIAIQAPATATAANAPALAGGPVPTPAAGALISEGAGFFISADGYLVTAEHVIDEAKSVAITTSDGVTYAATIVGTDASTDIAVLKVNANRPFAFVSFADQMPRVGDWVVAIGNPFGLASTATAGIVSAVSRDLGDTYEDYLQIDAPLNDGNSGGPTFNARGEVIGINDSIFSPVSGGSLGIGFDIPADTARMVAAEIEKSGRVTRGWLGIELLDGALANTAGVVITSPDAGGPAARAGLKAGDVITAINGAPISDVRGLTQTIHSLPPGSSVALSVSRNGHATTIEATLGDMPGPSAQ